MRVVIVGSGVAGLVTAIRASERHDVVLVTKAGLAVSATALAQGGIAVADGVDDSVELHVADTLRAGAGLADPAAVRVLCTEGPRRVRELIGLGMPFDLVDGELARGHEAAAHSVRRVLHADGDATGRVLEETLVAAVRARGIVIVEHAFLAGLAPDAGGGRVVGVDVVGPDGALLRIDADAVVLATGGFGQLYRHTTNPAVATGDGLAAAARAGAELVDLEFVQFHPTSLAVPGSPLISEAVRGEGATLVDERGRRFLLDVHPDAELAPRDVVARGIAAQMALQDGRPVLLDARALGGAFLAERFPGISAVLSSHGLDWARDLVPVTPAAHYAMGGIRTDLDGRTSLRGLFAVGEVARTGVHGANRLASNSLLEGLVFGSRAAEALGGPWTGPAGSVGEHRADGFGSRPASRAELQHLMWRDVGLVRDTAGLEHASRTLAEIRPESSGTPWAREDANLFAVARLVTAAATRRRESRGAHFRRDFPDDAGPAISRPAAVLEGAR